jgi:hypothetical protein
MTGPGDSVIGVKTEMVISKFLSRLPKRFETAGGEGQVNGAVIAINKETGKAEGIKRIQIRQE